MPPPPPHLNNATASTSSSSTLPRPLSLMGSTSTAAGLRRSARNLRSVKEVVGGKIQEVFLLDDDDDSTGQEEDGDAPPARPLAAELQSGNTNGRHHPSALHNGNNGSATTPRSGKRKAGASPPPAIAPPSRLPLQQSTSSLSSYDPSPTGTAAAQAAKKRKKDLAPDARTASNHHNNDLLSQRPMAASTYPHAYGQPSGASYAAQINSAQVAARQSWINQGHPSAVQYHPQTTSAGNGTTGLSLAASSYRGGYPAGNGVVPNGVGSSSSRQQIVQHAGDAAKRLQAYPQPSYHQPPPPPPLTAPALPVDDKDGHFIVREKEWISDPSGGENRYQILSQLGQGTFGKVVECYDRLERRYVAIKVIRAVQKYRDASQIEIRVLKALSVNDPRNENKCIHLLDTFSFRNHVCIVSELLGKSVFDFLRDNTFNPFPPQHIWSFAQQLLKSVAFLHRLNLVHTDLKPENILLVNSDYDWQAVSRRANARRKKVLKDTDIRLIDFGSATFNDEYHSQVVSTRHYRAPEIILNMGWSFPCDAWSIGCILIEFYTGEALFQTHDNLEHLAMMEQVLGSMPDNFRIKAETYKAEYFRNSRLDFPNAETPRNSRKYVVGMRRLGDIVSKATAWRKHNERFVDLLRRLMEFDPAQRIKVADALKHPYFELMPNEIPP